MVAEIIRAMLKRYDGNVTEVARVLKTTREKVRYRIEKYNIR
jgi:DNA-binding NtrC family response regulator